MLLIGERKQSITYSDDWARLQLVADQRASFKHPYWSAISLEDGALVEEAEGDVECGAAPHLQRRGVAQRVRRRRARLQDVVRPDARRQQALVRVPPEPRTE